MGECPQPQHICTPKKTGTGHCPLHLPSAGCPHPWHKERDTKDMKVATSPETPKMWPCGPSSHAQANSPSVAQGTKPRSQHTPSQLPPPPHLLQLARDRDKFGGWPPEVITGGWFITGLIRVAAEAGGRGAIEPVTAEAPVGIGVGDAGHGRAGLLGRWGVPGGGPEQPVLLAEGGGGGFPVTGLAGTVMAGPAGQEAADTAHGGEGRAGGSAELCSPLSGGLEGHWQRLHDGHGGGAPGGQGHTGSLQARETGHQNHGHCWPCPTGCQHPQVGTGALPGPWPPSPVSWVWGQPKGKQAEGDAK